MIEIIWHLFLTVCSGSTCINQDIQWFDNQTQCEQMLPQYTAIPVDGDWDTVEYVCKTINSQGT